MLFATSSTDSTDSSSDTIIDRRNEVNDLSPDSSIQQNNSLNRNNRLNMVISYSKEFLCILAFILTTFASVQNNSQKLSRAEAPVPFFTKGSVEDYYTGQLNPTQTKVSLSDLSFVFYYAPWCSESQNARKAYEAVARLFNREAYFSAINCWQPNSECRLQYARIHSWPILMSYQRNGLLSIQYQKNLWTESALTKFITTLLHPVERLETPDDLLELMSSKEALVVGFVDMKYHARDYKSFYNAALKFIEKDPFNEVGFAVVVGESSEKFGVDVSQLPICRMFLWNETLEYFGNSTWSSKEIGKWVNEHLHQVTFHLSPPGTKSSSLKPYLKQGPVMILFTPRNFYTQSDPYMMLHQIGLEYYNCGGDNWVQEMARDYMFERRKENRESHKIMHEECRRINHAHEKKEDCDSVSVSFASVLNNRSKNFDSKFKNLPNFCEKPKDGSTSCTRQSQTTCQSHQVKHLWEKKKKLSSFQTSMLNNDGDEHSPKAIEEYNFRRKCEMLFQAERNHELLFIDDEDSSPSLISGLACKHNRTFTLFAMDSVNYFTFAEHLGVDLLEKENMTAAIIIDHENESTYLLNQHINLSSLTNFISNYHRGRLTRFRRSNSVQYKHTHFFDVNEYLRHTKSNERKNVKISYKKKCELDNSKRKKVDNVVIKEIHSEDFEEAVLTPNKTVVVLFFSANCAFCTIMLHSLLAVSRILEGIEDLEFLRVDGDKNDLAWQFTASEYPSLIIFPLGVESESRKFPSSLPINATNVLWFILANVNRSKRLLALVMICNYKRQNSTNECINSIQEEISENISFLLREWRKHPRKRSVILRFIKQLKEIYLKLLSIKSSCEFLEVQEHVKKFADRWKIANS